MFIKTWRYAAAKQAVEGAPMLGIPFYAYLNLTLAAQSKR